MILGYSYRLEDISQRLFFTFSEAVYAIDLDKLMRNEDSLKLNCIVYTLVLDVLIKEYPSFAAAAREMGVSSGAIISAAKRNGTSCGYKWKEL